MKDHPKVYMIGNTHFDPVWLWTWDEAMISIRATFRSALDRMKEEPQFKYSFSCGPVFEWLDKVDPAMMEEIKLRVAENRWCVDEAMWLQPDCFSASGESYVRQCLYGQRYLLNRFGKLSTTAFNADCFGNCTMMPQILAKSGIPYAVFGRPDQKDLPGFNPLFRWKSPDGSETLCYRVHGVGDGWVGDIRSSLEKCYAWIKEQHEDALQVFGVTDHGGAPTKRHIAEINAKQKETDGAFVYSGTKEFFDNQKDTPCQTLEKEIPIRYYGVFYDCPDVKRENRIAEYAMQSAEKASYLGELLAGLPYPTKELQQICKDILFNQFHDILGGSSIRDAYKDAFWLYGRAIQTAKELIHTSLQKITHQIALDTESASDVIWNIVAWNLNPFPVSQDCEGEVQWAWEFDWYQGELCLTDEDGKEYPCQLIRSRENIPGFRSRFVFHADLPAMGYKVFRLHQRKSAALSAHNAPSFAENHLENDWLSITLDTEKGGLSNIIDKRTGKCLLKECGIPVIYTDTSDVWAFNLDGYHDPEYFTVQSVKLFEEGELRTRIRVTSVHETSSLEQDFLLCRDSDMVECRYRLNWQEKQKVLKLHFSADKENQSLTAASPYGQTPRSFDGVESPVGEWLDLSDKNGDGYTLYWDSVFAYDTEDSTVRASVVRSPIFGDLRIAELDMNRCYDYLGQGVLEGSWHMIPHKTQSFAKIWQTATALHNIPLLMDESNHEGVLPQSDSYLQCSDSDAVWVTVLKEAEDGSGDLILRLQNTQADAQTFSLSLRGKGTSPALKFAPYEIKTLRWAKEIKEVSMLEEDFAFIENADK